MPPLRLLVSAGWEHNNVLNRGQQFDVGGEYSPNFSGDFRASADAHYRVPYLILTRIDFQSHPFLYWERLDTVLRRDYGIETGLSRNVARCLSIGLFNRVRLVADTSRGITNSVALNALYDSRSDFFDPKHGLYLRPAAEVAGGVLRGDNDFYRLTVEARWFQAVGPGLVFAARALLGRDFPYGRTREIPYYEGFTLGGHNSLRGYPDQSVGPDSFPGERFGPLVLNTNLELRTPYAFGWVGLVGFLDGGEVVDSGTGFTAADYQYSAGAGVRVLTPIGPVRLDWGKRLKNPPPRDRGRLYLGLLHAF
jgi:outer membrane protein assembly factor BamA